MKDCPWIEEYRPKSLDDIFGQDSVIKRLKRWSKAIKKGNKSMPHFLFAGRTAGNGKTSVAMAFMRDTFGDQWENNWIQFNASDKRGIDFIRGEIKDFAKKSVIPHSKLGKVFNVIFLDEADALTPEAQAAMRGEMEQLVKTCRFILTCNFLSKIIEPIRNRCLPFRFRPLPKSDIVKVLKKIIKIEEIDIESEAILKIAENSKGSARTAINILNDLSLIPAEITPGDVSEVIPILDTSEASKLLKSALSASISVVDEAVIEVYDNGYTSEEIFDAIYDLLILSKLPDKTVRKIMAKMMDVEFHIACGCNELRQLRGFFIWLSLKAKK